MNNSVLYPKEFFKYFDQICKIPRGSGNEKGMVEYLRKFAAEHGLECYIDDHNNVLISKPATVGYEDLPTVALQGHTDMVCQKTADSDHDFNTDPIEWYVDGEYIKAKNTSLGADDGAAVCIMLTLLASADVPHPTLRCLFTAEEETGLFGAHGFDYSKINDAEYMINIDGEEEYEVLCSCAGGVRLHLNKTCIYTENRPCVRIMLDGLCGGHSGADIHLNRINANIALCAFLKSLSLEFPVQLAHFEGGTVDNAISPRAFAVVSGITAEEAEALGKKFESMLLSTATDADKGLFIKTLDVGTFDVIDSTATVEFINTVCELKHGVVKMSEDVPGLVQTSANVGIIDFKEGKFDIHISTRSSVEKEKNELCDSNAAVGEKYGFIPERGQSYPGWDFKKDSKLRPLYAMAFAKTHGGKEPTVSAIHAGLECGIISGHLPELDIIAIGPEMSGVHSPAEQLQISSVGRIYDTITELLRSLKD